MLRLLYCFNLSFIFVPLHDFATVFIKPVFATVFTKPVFATVLPIQPYFQYLVSLIN